MFRDSAGNTFTPLESLSEIVNSSGVPVYVFFDQFFGRGVVGGRVFSMDRQGAKVAGLALQILNGVRPSDISPSAEGTNVTLIDWRELHRWGISESRVPSDAVIQFRDTSPWEQYRWQIVGSLTLVAAEGVLIFALLAQRARRRRTEAALTESHRRIEYLAGRLITAQEEERHHIARELHDDVNQHVAALGIGISRLGHQLSDAHSARAQVDILKENTSRLSQRIRRMSHRLHSVVLQHVNLAAALDALCLEFCEIEGVIVDFHVTGNAGAIPPDAALCLYRIAQESLHNVVKHSGVKDAQVGLTIRADAIELTVSDRGVGFDQAQKRDQGGLGLVSIEERIRLLNGTLHVKTEPGKGTQLTVKLPLERQQAGLAAASNG
jgi:signal transduction histidine kinase